MVLNVCLLNCRLKSSVKPETTASHTLCGGVYARLLNEACGTPSRTVSSQRRCRLGARGRTPLRTCFKPKTCEGREAINECASTCIDIHLAWEWVLRAFLRFKGFPWVRCPSICLYYGTHSCHRLIPYVYYFTV